MPDSNSNRSRKKADNPQKSSVVKSKGFWEDEFGYCIRATYMYRYSFFETIVAMFEKNALTPNGSGKALSKSEVPEAIAAYSEKVFNQFRKKGLERKQIEGRFIKEIMSFLFDVEYPPPAHFRDFAFNGFMLMNAYSFLFNDFCKEKFELMNSEPFLIALERASLGYIARIGNTMGIQIGDMMGYQRKRSELSQKSIDGGVKARKMKKEKNIKIILDLLPRYPNFSFNKNEKGSFRREAMKLTGVVSERSIANYLKEALERLSKSEQNP